MRLYFRYSSHTTPRLHSKWQRRAVTVVLTALISALPVIAALAYDWPQFDGNSGYPGWNNQETTLTVQNAAHLAQKFQVALPSVADGAPAYLSSVNTGTATQDLLFLTTTDGHILALDAHNGSTVWSHQNGPGGCKINNGSSTCYTTSSPAVDPNKQFVYSYGLDGKAHKYQVGNGNETLTGGWPETTTLKAFDEKGSSALSIATDSQTGTSYLYVANGGYPGDNGDYQGHITAINLATGAQKVFNTLCSDQTLHFVEQPGTPDCPEVQSAVWARPGTVYDPLNNKIYIATGNGTYDPTNNFWGDSVLKLNPDGTGAGGKPLDSYTPTNFQQLQNGDTDLGSTVVALLPQVGGAVSSLGVQSGKDSLVRLLNLDNLSNQSGTPGPGHTGGELFTMNLPQGGEVLTMPATWLNPIDQTSWVFIVNDSGASALKLSYTGSVPKLTKVWQNSAGGTSPIIANNILFYVGGGSINAFDPRTGNALWNGSLAGGTHWESVMVANGWVYGTDQASRLTGFTLSSSLSPDTIGVYRSGTFYLRNSNTTGFADITISFNPAGRPYPVVGDWTGAGLDTIGVFDQNNGLFSLRTTNTPGVPNVQFVLGYPSDMPLAGRWTIGATHFGAGVFRPSNGLIYLKNSLTTGFADFTMVLGIPGDNGLAGDWNGDEVDSPAVYRPSTSAFYLADQVCNCALFGNYQFVYGIGGDAPVIGDWIGQGHDGIGLFRQSNGFTYLRNSPSTGFADNSFVYGIAGDVPIAGRWSGTGGPVPGAPAVLVPGTPPPSIAPPPGQPTGNGLGD
ncbi:MAG: outer membrane protein assembly factor BamB family protein [Aggregatilineales bacterium]